MDASPPSANRQIARAAGTVMFAIVIGQITGLVRGILVARAFPDFELDAFFASNQVAETLFTLLAAGALSSAFIPTFTGFLAKEEKGFSLETGLFHRQPSHHSAQFPGGSGCGFRTANRSLCPGARFFE
jgi:hypothetical protein